MADILIAGISGSLRKGSFNTLLLHAVQKLLPDNVEMEILSIADIPLYNADLDVPAAKERPAIVTAFRDGLTRANGILFVSPEYNYSIPGGLKNAIDWASRGEDSPMIHKPVSVMGATPGMWGTVRMHLAFHAVFQFLNMIPVYKPEILVAQANKKFTDTGEFTDDAAKELIKKNLENLKALILKSAQTL